MPPKKPSSKQSATKRKAAWMAVPFLLSLAALAYVWIHPGSASDGSAGVTTALAAAAPSSRHIYSETANPRTDIAAALVKAKSEHKRVLIDFGGDWCGDCQVLDIYFHQSPNADLLEKHFVLVHVWIGQMDANLDVASKYGVPISKGVPALAVVSPEGEVIYAQSTGQFNDMRHMDSSSVTEFLNKWKS